MNKPSLLILAGGLGSRYKGQKQVDKLTSSETLMEFALYDAIQVGIRKFVFIINARFPGDYQSYLQKILEEKGASVHFVEQSLDKYIPERFQSKISERLKPLGTGHAVYCAKEVIQEPFLTMNADDFYGKESFQKGIEAVEHPFSLVAFQLGNTLSENGTVSRGICQTENGFLQKVEEHTDIERVSEGIIGRNTKGKKVHLRETDLVSMNFWVLSPSFFELAARDLDEFLDKMENPMKEEFYLPSILDKGIQTGEIQIKVLESSENWMGLTYPEDKTSVVESLNSLKEKGIYPERLWD